MRAAAVIGSSVVVIGALAGCGGSDDEMVGGMTECTLEIVGDAAEEYAATLGDGANNYEIENLECADGWAVTTGVLGDGSGQGAPTSIIFEAGGQFWVPRTQADACGTYDEGTYPSDASIPESLYEIGCLT